MQFSQLEREVHNSPLKCATNNETSSPETGSPKLQQNAYRNSGQKAQSYEHVSPTKTTAGRQNINNSPSPVKFMGGENKDRAVEDQTNVSPQKFKSPERVSAVSSGKKSPSKSTLPFGKPIEIIKSKYQFLGQITSSWDPVSEISAHEAYV